jgi:hypothetical protein
MPNAQQVVVGGFFRRLQHVQSDRSIDYVPYVAELLSDFTPERAFHVLGAIEEMARRFMHVA